ncbi:hypothetical protein FACS1894137_14020 [Spirochaetia bacterium]|nr:hypothetical protein FACS1894137_14020 [Spirochaetia bacterium]
MKKKYLLIGCIIMAAAVFARAQDLETRVGSALTELALPVQNTVTVAVYPILLAGSETTSALSRYLYEKIKYFVNKNDRLLLSPSTRDTANTAQGRIEGAYTELGNEIDITLSLVSNTKGSIGAANFKITKSELQRLRIEWLPGNRVTQTDVQQKDQQIDAMLAEGPIAPAKTYTLDAWPNSESYTYAEGEKMYITLRSDRDCYFKVYYVDAENKMRLIYPNQTTGGNFLKANVLRIIPDTTEYIMGKPFGVESILVLASDKVLPYNTDEMMPVKDARGMTQVLKKTADAVNAADAAGIIVEKRFNYTVVPQNIIEETLSYPKPDSMIDFIQALQSVLKSEGGTFTGNEQTGTFGAGLFKGSYSINGASIIIRIQHPVEESLGWGVSKTRSMAGAFNFSFSRPENIQAAVETVRNGISSKGGVFSGDTRKGEFKASGIAGRYEVADNVRVSIVEKPFVLTNGLIEKEIKKFFGVK